MSHPYDQALIAACENGHHDLITPLVTVGASVNTSNSREDPRGRPLIAAIKNRQVECIKVLISLGADINTALGMAVRNGKFQDLETLLDAGADVNHLDQYEWPILMSAVSEGHAHCINCVAILQKAGIFTRIHLCAPIGNHVDRCQFFKEKRPWIRIHEDEMKKKEVYNLLIPCVGNRVPTEYYRNCVKVLHKHGADVNKATTDGWTPLMVACLDGNKDIVEFLLESGANVNATSGIGWTPLINAVVGDQYACAGTLIKAGADVNIEVPSSCVALNRKKNALGFAVDIGNIEMVKLLLLSGMRLLRVNMAKRTQNTNPEIAQLLIAAGYSSVWKKNIFHRPDKISPATSLLLSDQCRAVIRQRLFELRPSVNLLYIVPKLRLPSLLQEYLLFGVSLD